MVVAKANKSSPENTSRLSVQQLNALDLLVTGKTDRETAEAVGVVRETVCKWRNENPYFCQWPLEIPHFWPSEFPTPLDLA